MQKSVYTASCPICGRVLFKGSPDSYIEGGCPKCGEYLKISFTDCGFNAAAAKLTDKDGAQSGARTGSGKTK